MSQFKLDTPILDGGIRTTNFFNGRIVAREDMQREQDAERAVHERLGRAIGAGIVSGFEVVATAIGGSSIADPVVTVRKGLAVNRLGQTVALDRDVDVSLLQPSSASQPPMSGGFNACAPPESTVYVVGSGVYLLAAAPAQAKQGLALVSGLGNQGAPCNAKEIVDGVQLRLVSVKALTAAELADDAHLRNVVAYKFFLAAGAGADAARDPLGIAPAAAAALTDPPLTDCDVPLALLQWTTLGGVRWVDLWSVRRNLGDLGPRASVGLAMRLQFQAHLADLIGSQSSNLRATDSFVFLPPLGIIPLQGTSVSGLDIGRFFTGLTRRTTPAFVEGAKVPALVADAGLHPPIDTRSKEMLWTYFVRENQRAVDVTLTPPLPQPYLLFTNGQVPYRGDARFDLSYWSYASYAIGGSSQ